MIILNTTRNQINLNHSLPRDYVFDDSDITFLDSNSSSYNYGHYMVDNVLGNYAATRLFGLQFNNTRQLFEASCYYFGDYAVGLKEVGYNKSMGTYREACLEKLNMRWHYFFDHPPRYLDRSYASNTIKCYKNILVGQGSTFSVKSLDLSRGTIYREFRDYLLSRLSISNLIIVPEQENLIVVAIRSFGHSGGEQVTDLCNKVKSFQFALPVSFKIECIVPQDLTFLQEIHYTNRTKIIISVHVTVSYMSLFAKDGTHQIILADRDHIKEFNILGSLTHIQIAYLPFNKIKHNLLGLILKVVSYLKSRFRVNMNYKEPYVVHEAPKESKTIYEVMVYPENQLYRSNNKQTRNEIYIMYNQTRHLIKNLITLIALGRNIDEVISIDYKELKAIPKGFILEYVNDSFIHIEYEEYPLNNIELLNNTLLVEYIQMENTTLINNNIE